MGLTRTSRRIAGWLAILAMALNALWPLVANAKPAGAFDPSTEICTVGGIKTFGDAPSQQSGHTPEPHCAFCSLGADKLALPVFPAEPVLATAQPEVFLPGIPDARPQEPSGYPSAPPRAPPVLS